MRLYKEYCMNKKIILASQSARRKKIFADLGLPFTCIVPTAPEVCTKQKPFAIVQQLAYNKAREIARTAHVDKRSVILGADTIVVCKGEIIGKPTSHRDAQRILKKITTYPHYVYSGIAVIDTHSNTTYKAYDRTKVIMRSMTHAEMQKYSKQHLDKAGAYAIQDDGDALVEKIVGEYYTVVGLPLEKTVQLLRQCGITINKEKYKGLQEFSSRQRFPVS